MQTTVLILFTAIIVLLAYWKVRTTLKEIKANKKELQRLVRERMQREESFDDCVDYGKV